MSIDDLAGGLPKEEVPLQEAEFVGTRPSFQLPAFLTADSGPGPISDYVNHALNFNGSLGLAQVIRGATGMLGSLNKAIFDIAFGLMRMYKKPTATPKEQDYNI